MRDYALKLEQFGISPEAYAEMRNFCWQYQQKKDELSDILYAAPYVPDGTPKSFRLADPTSIRAIKMKNLLTDCQMIEQSAIAAVQHVKKTEETEESVLYQHLLRQVTHREKPPVDEVPCGRRQFYEMRRLFFCHLHLKRTLRGSAFEV